MCHLGHCRCHCWVACWVWVRWILAHNNLISTSQDLFCLFLGIEDRFSGLNPKSTLTQQDGQKNAYCPCHPLWLAFCIIWLQGCLRRFLGFSFNLPVCFYCSDRFSDVVRMDYLCCCWRPNHHCYYWGHENCRPCAHSRRGARTRCSCFGSLARFRNIFVGSCFAHFAVFIGCCSQNRHCLHSCYWPWYHFLENSWKVVVDVAIFLLQIVVVAIILEATIIH